MKDEPIIKLENVWKIYKFGKEELDVLKGINLEIFPADFVSIMGSSGSGKSTLLHIIGCLDTPSRGKVYLSGNDTSKMSEDQLAAIRGKKVGFIFQQFNLFSNLNGLENVALPMVFQRISEKKRVARAKELLFSVDLEDRIFHKPKELSGGEQQRIAISRALANNPEIIVADEPTGNLDSVNGKKIMEILIRLHEKENKTIIIVTHDSAIAKYSEKIINIKDGEIVG
ncbi:MAG: ABC transporter ATP-binding protein [Candidatus Nealsonbacteria bacterium RIFCSPHIGHO2_01_FULL_38_55]|uniref:ABC transporter ATP-binding protein n=2 Tax=Candidatus Nealsoniibacteriota TaxID=1817911 RepID=A0A1G2EJC7_9BACT|nr:MAG: ABC transport system protein [Parcubacteria group bacterium GW2011_GWA2_38_27]KKQ96222.1 MAG: ABC transport system protein [Parcubacteria group bacterium GW2011_GWC2_39_11]OGZ20046.1 MAG: ABC transporter ATP-binding protein [Candidatus Nealsonbacteria bacterium RIFCSPHIGHO2_01_FULL_38_55]OGZ21600.1 MAG: ABC transporter ATP-binding protein [Candidatus Nealsonbacteria bacterium RIFCSPHIGHO2_02_38_10]OGZ22968.1 MAG: ABC transporter ATP-binding protein [Candidatus Nealsonbacteria bacterium 